MHNTWVQFLFMTNSWRPFPGKFVFMETIFIVIIYTIDLVLHNDALWHKRSEVSWTEHLSVISSCIQKKINGKNKWAQRRSKSEHCLDVTRPKKGFFIFPKSSPTFFCAVYSVKLILISSVQIFPSKTNNLLRRKNWFKL